MKCFSVFQNLCFIPIILEVVVLLLLLRAFDGLKNLNSTYSTLSPGNDYMLMDLCNNSNQITFFGKKKKDSALLLFLLNQI